MQCLTNAKNTNSSSPSTPQTIIIAITISLLSTNPPELFALGEILSFNILNLSEIVYKSSML